MKTCITYYGGKQQLLPKLLEVLPQDRRSYCEPFAGGLALYFKLPAHKFEVINDTNAMVVNFYEVCRSDFDALKEKIEATPFSRLSYKVAMSIYRMPHLFNKLQQAWAFFVATQCGFAAQIGSFGFDKKGKRIKTFNNKKLRFTKDIADRLKGTLIEHKDAVDTIKTYDSEDMFFYLDPPYVTDGNRKAVNQGHYSGYSLLDYRRLLDCLASLKGRFLLSSYPSNMLQDYASRHGWWIKEFDKPLSARKSTKGKPRGRKTEVLCGNYKKDI